MIDDHVLALILSAADDLSEQETARAVRKLRDAQQRHGLDPATLRRVFVLATRQRGIADRMTAAALAASREPEPRQGNPDDIPGDWRQCTEVGFIAPTANLASILERGILSHSLARTVEHESIADKAIQLRRGRVEIDVGGGRKRALHSFANAYLNPRNAMLRRVRDSGVVVLKLSAPAIFVLAGARVSDRNLAVYGAQTLPLPTGLAELDPAVVLGPGWFDGGYRNEAKMQIMQAEILVPDSIPARLITRMCVRTENEADTIRGEFPKVRIDVDRDLFFDR
jgi:hypothetical protein